MNKVIVITGGSSGLGRCIIEKIQADKIYNLSLTKPEWAAVNTEWIECDVKEEGNIWAACDDIDPVDILINNAGVNEIDWLENFDEESWDNVIDTNAKGIYLMTKELLPKLKASKGTVLNIVSNAAHVPMTCSLAYNASKAAAHIMTKQLARELKELTVFGIAPNRLAGTGMSDYIDQRVVETRGWDMAQVRSYQEKALPAGEETDPEALAEFIAWLLSTKKRHKYLTGCILPYGA